MDAGEQNNAPGAILEAIPEQSKGEIIEVPIKAIKPSNDFRIAFDKRRESMAELANKIGFRNMDKKILAQQFKVSERQIYLDIDWIKGHWKPENLRDIKVGLQIANERALNEALLLLATSSSHEDKARAIQVLLQASKSYREEMEEWGGKEKTAGRIDLTSGGKEIDETQIFIYLDKLRKEKKKHDK